MPTSTVLLQTGRSWDGETYRQYPAGEPRLTLLKIVIPSNTMLPWHSHPMPNAAYVMSGTLFLETTTGSERVFHAGDVLAEVVDTVHRGRAGDSDVELLVFYAGAEGLPLFRPAQ